MENVTVHEGENATLLCKASSDSTPQFQWLRWHSSASNGTTAIEHPHFEVIKQNLQNPDEHLVLPKINNKIDFYGVKLTLVKVTKENEGKYICIVGNAVGFAVEQAYVIILDQSVLEGTGRKSPSNRPPCPVPNIGDKKRNEKEVVDVNAGKDVQLICQVKENGLITSWLKYNNTISPSDHPRMRLKLNKYLKIKKVQKDDSGFYTCVAENDCGKNTYTVQLVVGSATKDLSRNSTPAPPRFTVTQDKLSRSLLSLPVGNSVKLDCSAEGYPRPTVTWYKDGARFLKRKGESRLYLGRWTFLLNMKDLVPTDTGTYTCNVSNAYGWINHTYYVDVHERARAEPVVLPMDNVTVHEGENATLLCKALSDSMPHFQWLRWHSSASNGTTSSTIEHPHYEVIKQNLQNPDEHLVLPKSNKFDFYGVKLTLVKVTKEDEGKYTCIVGNAVGFAVEQAYVIILDQSVNFQGIYLGHKPVQTDSALPATTTRPTTQRQQNISTAYGPTTTSAKITKEHNGHTRGTVGKESNGTVEKGANGLTSREITIVSAFGSVVFIVVAALAPIFFKKHWAGRKPNIPDDSDEEEIQPYATVRLSRIFPLNDESNGPGNNDIPLKTLPSQLRTPQEKRATGRTELGNSPYENTDHLGGSSVTPVEYLFYQPRYENEAVDSESRNVVIRPGYDKLTPATSNPPCEYDSLIRETDLRCESRRGDITDTEGEDNMNTHTILEVPTSDERTPACSMDKKKNQENSLGKIKSECIENVWKKETLI